MAVDAGVTEGRTALVVLVPEAEPVVGEWRRAHDPSATRGMPAHVTVLWPWLPVSALDAATLRDLGDVFAAVPAFDASFTDLQRFPRTLWVAPSPADAFSALTGAVHARWPELPPYAGAFDDVIPHLTVGDAVDVAALGHVVSAVAPALPVSTRVSEVVLMAPDGDGRWQRHSAYPLAAGAS